MHPGKNDDNDACPHCGAENPKSSEAWLNLIEDEDTLHCATCKQRIDDNQAASNWGGEKRVNLNFNISFFIIVFLLLILLMYLNHTFNVLTLKDDSTQIVYEILLILFVSSALASGKIRQNLKFLAIWIGIFGVLIVGYSYRYELSGIKEKVLGNIIPSKGLQESADSISFPVSSDGHFHIRTEVNGTPVIFMADTGASHIVLSPADARKLGIKMDELRFDRLYETANGIVRGSYFRIDDLRIGAIHLKDIGASINGAEMRDSLLGMTFFKRLKRYEVENDLLTLYWEE